MIERINNIDHVPEHNLALLGNSFTIEGKIPGGFDLPHFKNTWRVLLNNNMGAMFVTRKDGEIIGGIGGILYTTMFNPRLLAVETFWYVGADHRGGMTGIRLHREFEAWAIMHGARDIVMVRIHDVMPQALATYYENQGYRAFETCYIRSL